MNSDPTNSTLHVFGGGKLIKAVESIALKAGWGVVVRTGKRFENSFPPLHSSTRLHIGDNLTQLIHDGGAPKRGDFGISISAPWVFTQEIIDSFSGDLFNLHSQPLPKFRGGGGTSWLILLNERTGGCCVHRLIRKIDAGSVHARLDFPFPRNCRYPADFDAYLLQRAEELIGSWLPRLLATRHPGPEILVNERESEYWPRLNEDIHSWIDWSWSLADIESFCNAFSDPYNGAKTTIRGAVARLKNVNIIVENRKYHPYQRGLIFRTEADGQLVVAHPDGALIIRDVALEDEALKPRLGDRFFTPAEILTDAMTRRVQYLPSGEIINI